MLTGHAALLAGTPTVAAFNPLTAISWYAAYWASDPGWTPPSDGSALTAGWRDGSGNSRDLASPTTAGYRPVYRASETALNSKPCVDFDGTDDFLGVWSLSLSTTYSLVVIFKYDAATTFGRIIDCNTSFATLFHNGSGSFGKFSLYAGSVLDSAVTLDATTAHLGYGVITSSTDTVGIDAGSSTGAAGGNTVDRIILGNNGSIASSAGGPGGNQGSVRIAFAGAYSGDITADGQWSAFRTWANTFYGVTV